MKNIKKLIKNNLKVVIGIIIGIIISGLTVTATTILYNADQVSFTAEDSDFTATNVNEALNLLYNKSKYFDNISVTDCISGTYHHQPKTQISINVGFIPSKVYMEYAPNSTYTYYNSYNKDLSPTVLLSLKTNNSWTIHDWSAEIKISSTVTSQVATNMFVYLNDYNVHYIFCK